MEFGRLGEKMNSIEIKSNDYTYRFDFPLKKEVDDSYDEPLIVETEDLSNAEEVLNIMIDLLRCCFGSDEVDEAIGKVYLDLPGSVNNDSCE